MQPKHRGHIPSLAKTIEYMWWLNVGLACGVIFIIVAELLRAVS